MIEAVINKRTGRPELHITIDGVLVVRDADYTGIATHLTDDGRLMAVVGNYWSGVLPVARLLEIRVVEG